MSEKRVFVLAAIPSVILNVVWDKIEPILQRVIKVSNNELTAEGIYKRALSGESLIVAVCLNTEIVAVTVLNVVTFDTGLRAMYVPIVGGKYMNEWVDESMLVAKAIAKDYNCTELRGFAVRKGWLRRMKEWKTVSTIIKCDVGV